MSDLTWKCPECRYPNAIQNEVCTGCGKKRPAEGEAVRTPLMKATAQPSDTLVTILKCIGILGLISGPLLCFQLFIDRFSFLIILEIVVSIIVSSFLILGFARLLATTKHIEELLKLRVQ